MLTVFFGVGCVSRASEVEFAFVFEDDAFLFSKEQIAIFAAPLVVPSIADGEREIGIAGFDEMVA